MNSELFDKIAHQSASEFDVLEYEYDESKEVGNIIIRSNQNPHKIHMNFDPLFKKIEKEEEGMIHVDENHYYIIETDMSDTYKIVIKHNHEGIAYRTHKFVFEYDMSQEQSDIVFTIAGMIEDNRSSFSTYDNNDLALFSVVSVLLSNGMVEEDFQDLSILSHKITRKTFNNIADIAGDNLNLDISPLNDSKNNESAFDW